jgi:hypothetical protein
MWTWFSNGSVRASVSLRMAWMAAARMRWERLPIMGATVSEGTPGEPRKDDESAVGPDPGTPHSGYRFGPGTLQPGRGANATVSNTPWLRTAVGYGHRFQPTGEELV